MNRIVLALYSMLMWLGQPLLRRKLASRSRQEPGYSDAPDERFGRYTQPAETTPELVWVHAVSLGETRTAAVLVKAMREQFPGLCVLLTHGTATGRAEGASLLRPGDVQVWQPWDSEAGVARFLAHFKPRLGLLMETEVWPNVVAAAAARAIPLLLINARLSEKSLQQALAMAPLSCPAYGALTAVYAQTEDDAKRLRQLGAPVCGIFGNLKFDAAPDPAQLAMGKTWRRAVTRPVIMFASSRDGEEELFFKEISAAVQSERAQAATVSKADAEFSDSPERRKTLPHFLVVPRHPQRFDDVQALAQKHGLGVSRRSHWRAGPCDHAEACQADVWLGDTLGDMALYYALSDVALLGGSFAPLGGQNLIEAAACGCPVVMGPHTFNFSEAAAFAEASGAAQRVADMHGAVVQALQLSNDAPAREHAAAAGLAFAARNRGACAGTLAALTRYL